MMLLFRYCIITFKWPQQYINSTLTVHQSTSIVYQQYINSTSIVRKSTSNLPKIRLLTSFVALQVLASKAWAGEGARLPLQDHDLRAQPAHQQLLTTAACDHCLEPSITCEELSLESLPGWKWYLRLSRMWRGSFGFPRYLGWSLGTLDSLEGACVKMIPEIIENVKRYFGFPRYLGWSRGT